MNEKIQKESLEKRPYTTPKLEQYGSVSKLTEAKSSGPSDIGSTTQHNVA
jgi:hypothetical protein